MAEEIRSVKVTIEIDTNKRTERREFEASGLGEAARQAVEFLTEFNDES
jgi:hypothetical protein